MEQNRFLIRNGLLRILVVTSARTFFTAVETLKISEPSLSDLAGKMLNGLQDFVTVITDSNANDAEQIQGVFDEHKTEILLAGLGYGEHLLEQVKNEKLRASARQAVELLTKLLKKEKVELPTIADSVSKFIATNTAEASLDLFDDILNIYIQAGLISREDTPETPPK